MEDALISPVGLAVLSGAGLIEEFKDDATNGAIFHATETVEVVKKNSDSIVSLTHLPIGVHSPQPDSISWVNDGSASKENIVEGSSDGWEKKGFYTYIIPLDSHGDIQGQPMRTVLYKDPETGKTPISDKPYDLILPTKIQSAPQFDEGDLLMIDYYYLGGEATSVTQIDIDATKFAGNYYLEASTLWRNKDGVDIPAEFIIPNCKIQSNFTFSMASSGDPSTFTFTLDAFPDYTKYDSTKKVLCSIRLMEEDNRLYDDVGHYHARYVKTEPAKISQEPTKIKEKSFN